MLLYHSIKSRVKTRTNVSAKLEINASAHHIKVKAWNRERNQNQCKQNEVWQAYITVTGSEAIKNQPGKWPGTVVWKV